MYKSIFKTDETVDADVLLSEFGEKMTDRLKVLYADLDSWTGVIVFRKNGENELNDLPALRSISEKIGVEHINMIFYTKMEMGGIQHEHRDMYGNLLFNCSRIHIPLQTNPDAFLKVQGIDYHLKKGEVWCLDTAGKHAARNTGDCDRIHLIIDVGRAPETEKYFPPRNFEVYIHLFKFIIIMGPKIVRDVIIRPRSILSRLKGLYKVRNRS